MSNQSLTQILTSNPLSFLQGTEPLYTVSGGADAAFTTATLATYVQSTFYSQGVWTPTVVAATTPGTPAYTYNVGSYEKIGRLVIARFSIILSGWTGSPSGAVSIAGLPFALSSATDDYATCNIPVYSVSALATSNYGLSGFVGPGSSVITLYSTGNSSISGFTAAQAGTTPEFFGTISYHI